MYIQIRMYSDLHRRWISCGMMYRCTWSWKRLVNERVLIRFPCIAQRRYLPKLVNDFEDSKDCVIQFAFLQLLSQQEPEAHHEWKAWVVACHSVHAITKQYLPVISLSWGKRTTVKFRIATDAISLMMGAVSAQQLSHWLFVGSEFQLSLLPTQIHTQLDSRAYLNILWIVLEQFLLPL